MTLADEVGIDVLLHTSHTMKAALGPRMAGANIAWLQAIVDAKMLGRKTGSGFYLYPPTPKGVKKDKGGKEKAVNPEAMKILEPFRTAELATLSSADCVDRMLLRFVKE